MKKAVTAIAFAALLTAGASAQAEDGTPYLDGGDPEAGESLSQTCAACHGPDGNSPQAQWPNIAGQHASYTFQQLKDFKAGEGRSNAQMTGMVADLSEEDMRDLAAYYAKQDGDLNGPSIKRRP
jgi:cytochrome c553